MSDLDAQLRAIDAGILSPIVDQALNTDRATVDHWACTPLSHGAINPVTAGLYQFTGTARAGQEQLPWSVVLKVIHRVDLSGTPLAEGYMDEPGDWNYWKREALVFQSGILDGWRGDLVPVRCYQVAERPDGAVWVWLEHLREPAGATWTVERHIRAAFHFGQFNGAYCGARPVPDFPWLCKSFLRQWVRTFRAFGVEQIVSDPAFWEHPRVRSAFPTPIAGRATHLLGDADRLLARLERQPQTLSHLDTHYANLFDRSGEQGQDQTVVIDWSFLGVSAVGEDLGMQISGNLFALKVDPADARPYYEAALEAYLDGLQDAGWRGAAEDVRFAASAAASLRLVPFGLKMLKEQCTTSEGTSWADHLAREQGATVEGALGRWGQAITFLLDLADQARRLADRI